MVHEKQNTTHTIWIMDYNTKYVGKWEWMSIKAQEGRGNVKNLQNVVC